MFLCVFGQKFKSMIKGALLKTEIQVGDDTRFYFSVSIWQKEMGSMVVAGDVVLLQNVKIVTFGDVGEAGTVQYSSLKVLVHPYELLMSKGITFFPCSLFLVLTMEVVTPYRTPGKSTRVF
ncbi:hypothetical protein GIB67_017879 [Kingdonia uniflora]|uniref:Uncharacterized protein n=1 Tax=Kingdonia uniflora TaxID=39325 RepID=A0A7J7ML48_9MAGN|nr:hypothetical protein GIB67_017879 [Kingdonia uniflora]